jgi:hypothetical protein
MLSQVKLYGFCSKEDKLCMIMELARGALSNLLFDKDFLYCGMRGGAMIYDDVRAAMLLDVAKGLKQL